MDETYGAHVPHTRNNRKRNTQVSGDEHPPNKRKEYCHKKRVCGKCGETEMGARWKLTPKEMKSGYLSTLKCCATLQLFRHVNPATVCYEANLVIGKIDSINRRSYLMRMTIDQGRFVFNGRHVCSPFIVEAFRFSRDMQIEVKKERLGGFEMKKNSPPSRTKSALSTTRHNGLALWGFHAVSVLMRQILQRLSQKKHRLRTGC